MGQCLSMLYWLCLKHERRERVMHGWIWL